MTNTNEQKECYKLLSVAANDSRLSVSHLALIVGILELTRQQNGCYRIKMSRSKLMKLAHINTAPTYHKYLKELQEFKYIKYDPSYDPRISSTIEILDSDEIT